MAGKPTFGAFWAALSPRHQAQQRAQWETIIARSMTELEPLIIG